MNTPEYEPEHMVARCRWHSVFDDEHKAYQLQSWLSHFSETELLPLLEQGFERFCPAGQTWRIDTLTLDLGELAYDQLSVEMPQRISECLIRALTRLFQLHPPLIADDISAAALTNSSQTQNDFLRTFLQSGIAPWWYRGQLGSLDILEQQRLSDPQALAYMLRELGQAALVRRRMVWQWGGRGIKKVVIVLEPHHHDYILDFAANLRRLQLKTQHPRVSASVFERHSWLWLLTHLLVERGSLFNTMAFVKSTLRQLATEFKLDYHSVLHAMIQTVNSLQYKGSTTPMFIQALLAVNANETATPQTQTIDYWQLMALSLQQYPGPLVVSGKTIHLVELFDLLVGQNRRKMTLLLKKWGREPRVRQQLVTALDDKALAKIVALLAPQDHLFIVAYAKNVQAVTFKGASHGSEQASRQLVWQVILAHLLMDGGSHFNRRQLVYMTLLKISQAQGINYYVLLDLLLHLLSDSPVASPNQSTQQHRFELFNILNQLRQQAVTRQRHASGGIGLFGSAQWPLEQRLATLFSCLRGASHHDDLSYEGLNAGLNEASSKGSFKTLLQKLLKGLLPRQSQALLAGFARQKDAKVLLQKLLQHIDIPLVQQWMNSLSPFTTAQQNRLLKQWQILLEHSGLWRGSSALLLQKLQQTFWWCVTECAISTGSLAGKCQPEHLLAMMIKTVCQSLAISLTDCLTQLQQSRLSVDSLWLRVIGQFESPAKATPANQAGTEKPLPQRIMRAAKPVALSTAQPIILNNAGLVLMQSYISVYFNRLGLLDDNQFISEQAQWDAVHYLQYLVSGQSATEEQHLVLNKLLCGLHINDPVMAGIVISAEDKALADGLIEAMINYWPAIGATSIDGFRGNWLVRPGSLSEEADQWRLVVEKRAYDLLLQKAPFSYHIIKLPWMTKPLYVSWPV